jgi:hypothetical protein
MTKASPIEEGWANMSPTLLATDATDLQIVESRKIFFCGALHVWAAITEILERREEPNERDLRRLRNIHFELEAFVDEMIRSNERTN